MKTIINNKMSLMILGINSESGQMFPFQIRNTQKVLTATGRNKAENERQAALIIKNLFYINLHPKISKQPSIGHFHPDDVQCRLTHQKTNLKPLKHCLSNHD